MVQVVAAQVVAAQGMLAGAIMETLMVVGGSQNPPELKSCVTSWLVVEGAALFGTLLNHQ